ATEGRHCHERERGDGEARRHLVAGVLQASRQRHGHERERNDGEARRHFLGGVLQTSSLYFVFGAHALQWVTPYLLFFLLLDAGYSTPAAAGWAAASAIAVLPVLATLAVAAKWALLGRVRPGRHRLWGGYHLRWWLTHSLVRVLPMAQLAGTPLLPIVYQLLGVRIGKDVHLGTEHIAAFDLVSIGDGSSVDRDAS